MPFKSFEPFNRYAPFKTFSDDFTHVLLPA
jgi:hypothetical protein